MPAPELLERPTVQSKGTVQISPKTTREKMSLLVGLLFAICVGAVFLKLMEYEVSHTFQWLHHSVQLDPAWY